MKTKEHQKRRRGVILVLTGVMMILLLGMVAFAVDVGYLALVRTQLQTSADSAALAAASDILNHASPSYGGNTTTSLTLSQTVAGTFAASNLVAREQPRLAVGDVTFGRFAAPFSSSTSLVTATPDRVNAAKVLVRREAGQNGQVGLFFGRVFGVAAANCQAQATAAFIDNFSGFTMPSDGSNLGILPFALDIVTWNSLTRGGGADEWNWDEETKSLSPGSDGIREANLFPQGANAPGNRGTVRIGHHSNSTAVLSSQIRNGLSASDLADLGGSLQLDDDGTLLLPGDPGISAGMKDDLASIIGQTRIIPLFSQLTGNGANAKYTIIGFAGVRVLDVDLTGKLTDKHLTVQPASVSVIGGIPGDDTQYSSYIFSPIQLVR